jgi:hypothetical protein
MDIMIANRILRANGYKIGDRLNTGYFEVMNISTGEIQLAPFHINSEGMNLDISGVI